MARLRRDYDELSRLDIAVLVVGPEKPAVFKRYWDRAQLPFTGLPDPEHRVSDLYGQDVQLLKLGRLPAQMLIDKSGVLRYVHYGHSMMDLPDVSAVEKFLPEL